MEHAAARAVADTDLVVVTGGASVGEKDFAKRMFEPVRLELLFSKVSIKPGKPVWLGRAGKTLVMGLPGNPSSALVTARLLLAPLIAGLSGRDPQETLRWRKAALATGLAASGPRETFHRARLSGEEVELLGFQDSSAQKALADADVLVRQPAGHQEISEGAKVDTLEF
jgi:molybdopterin molybdotransferase